MHVGSSFYCFWPSPWQWKPFTLLFKMNPSTSKSTSSVGSIPGRFFISYWTYHHLSSGITWSYQPSQIFSWICLACGSSGATRGSTSVSSSAVLSPPPSAYSEDHRCQCSSICSLQERRRHEPPLRLSPRPRRFYPKVLNADNGFLWASSSPPFPLRIPSPRADASATSHTSAGLLLASWFLTLG